jgi:hypothetical protein
MEGRSITNKPDVYRAFPLVAAKFCIVEVIYENADVALARQLVQTLKAAH